MPQTMQGSFDSFSGYAALVFCKQWQVYAQALQLHNYVKLPMTTTSPLV